MEINSGTNKWSVFFYEQPEALEHTIASEGTVCGSAQPLMINIETKH